MTTLPNQQAPTKQVYVYGNAYYDAMEGVEIKVFFDHNIVFTVPASVDIEEPDAELDAMVMRNAEERARQRLIGLSMVLRPIHWELEYSVHNVGE